MFIIPQQDTKKYSQTNAGDFSGNIRRTKNITFAKKGYISLEKRTRLLFDSATWTDLTTASTQAIVKIARGEINTGQIWVAGGKALHYLDSDLNVTKDVASGTPTLDTSGFNDACSFQADSGEVIFVAYSTALKYWDSSAWSSNVSQDVGAPNILCVFENLRALAVAGVNNKVQLIDSTKTKSTLLTLPANFLVTSLTWNNNRMYVGTYNKTDATGFVFEWDGLSEEANNGYPISRGQVFAMCRYNTGVAFVMSSGGLFTLDSGVKQVAQFPIFDTEKQWMADANFVTYQRNVSKGGMVSDKDNIFIAVDGQYHNFAAGDDTDETFENDFPSGIWCYNPSVGLHHRYSVDGSIRTVTGAITTANVNTATGVITIPSSICPDTGTPVFYDDASDGVGTLLTPLKFNTRYFVIKVSGTTLKLATTYANALAGTAITLTGTGNNSQTLAFCPNDSFGGILQQPVSLMIYKQEHNSPITENSKASRILIGSLIAKTTYGTTVTGVHSPVSKQENRGYFITPRLQSPNVKDAFQKIFIKFKPLVYPEDKILFKYRKVASNPTYTKVFPTSPIGTWVNATSFTIPDTSDITGILQGNEIEIVRGAGSGYLAHISNVSAASGGAYTITIDETVQNISAGQTFYFTVDNWKKLPTVLTSSSSSNADGFAEIPLSADAKSTAIELKIELRGEDVSIEEVQVVTNSYKTSN